MPEGALPVAAIDVVGEAALVTGIASRKINPRSGGATGSLAGGLSATLGNARHVTLAGDVS